MFVRLGFVTFALCVSLAAGESAGLDGSSFAITNVCEDPSVGGGEDLLIFLHGKLISGLLQKLASPPIAATAKSAGKDVEFTATTTVKDGDQTFTVKYHGKLDGDDISGTTEISSGGIPMMPTVTFSGKRAAKIAKYEPPVYQNYQLVHSPHEATLTLDHATIHFSGLELGQGSGQDTGELQVAGSIGSGSSSNAGSADAFIEHYEAGVAKMTFAGHTITLTKSGTHLAIDGKEFDLDGGKLSLAVDQSTGAIEKR